MPKSERSTASTLHLTELPSDFSEEEATQASAKHPINVLICEWDWRLAQQAMALGGLESVSDVVRTALSEWLGRHAQLDVMQSLASSSLRFDLDQALLYEQLKQEAME